MQHSCAMVGNLLLGACMLGGMEEEEWRDMPDLNTQAVGSDWNYAGGEQAPGVSQAFVLHTSREKCFRLSTGIIPSGLCTHLYLCVGT